MSKILTKNSQSSGNCPGGGHTDTPLFSDPKSGQTIDTDHRDHGQKDWKNFQNELCVYGFQPVCTCCIVINTEARDIEQLKKHLKSVLSDHCSFSHFTFIAAEFWSDPLIMVFYLFTKVM